MDHILSIVLFTPLAGFLVLLFIPSSKPAAIKLWANIASFASFLVCLPLISGFDRGKDFQFVEKANWIPSIGASYHLGIDGYSLLLVALTGLLGFLSVLASWSAIEERLKEYYGSFLLLQVGMLGVFMSLDFLLFFVFWELVLVPMYFIIAIWGGARRVYAAIKFIIYTLVGSVLMFLGILTLYMQHFYQTHVYTFDVIQLMSTQTPPAIQWWIFWAFFVGFAVKVPMFPLHTWLPDAHTEAPTAGSVILASVLLKMGTYGFLRFSLPLLPDAAKDPTIVGIMAALSIVAIVYGALVSMQQKDLKKLVAYSSVSHMGFVTLGIFASIAVLNNAQGMEGAILVMFSHGLLTGALFLLVGFLYERTHTRDIAAMSRLATPLPILAGFFMFFTLGSLGLPGLSGFVGEFLSLLGLFHYSHWLAAIAALGVILAACYLLWMYQRVLFNDRGDDAVKPGLALTDFNSREIVSLLPLVVFVVWLGVYPTTFLNLLHLPVQQIVGRVMPSLAQAHGGALAQLVHFTRGLF